MPKDSEIGVLAAVGPLGNPPQSKYERLVARAKAVPAATTVVAYPCDKSSLRGADRCGGRRHHRSDPGRPGREDHCGGARARSRHRPLRDRRRPPQRSGRRQGGRAHPRVQRRAADEGQPAHRRDHARGDGEQDRPAHRPADQPRLHHGRADLRGDAVHHRRRDQHFPGSRCQARHRSERDRSVHAGRSRHTAGGNSLRRRDRDLEDSLHDRGGRALQDGRTRADHRRHPRRPARLRQRHRSRGGAGSRASSRRSPAARRSWSCPIWKRATCWPRTSRSSPRRTRPASCSARACRSS